MGGEWMMPPFTRMAHGINSILPIISSRLSCGTILFAAVAAILAAAAVTQAAAPLPPNLNPGAMQNQFLQSQPKPQPKTASTQPVLTGPNATTQPSAKSGGLKFTLRRIQFNPSQFLTIQQLRQIVEPYIDKQVGFADLENILHQIDALYLHQGILTGEAVLPPQKIHNGVLTIELVEGKVGKVQLKGSAPNGVTTTGENYFLDRVPLVPGQILNDAALAEALNYFNRTTDIQLRATLQPGAQFGLTNVLLYAQEPDRVTLDLDVDNYGNPSTGRLEGTEYLNLYSPLSLDDRLNVDSVQSQGAIDNSINYSIPITTFGTQIGVSYANSWYDIVNGSFVGLDVKGRSWLVGGNLVQPIYADEHWLVECGFQYAYDVSHTLIGGMDLGATNVNKASGGLTIQGNWTQGAFSLVQTALYSEGTQPSSVTTHPFIYDGSFYGFYNFTPQVYASLLSGWQYTHANDITPDELFQAGGEYSVRGYPTNAVAGYSGFFTQTELHYKPVALFDGYAFYDQAYLWAPAPTYQRMQSAGVGTKWTFNDLLDRFKVNPWSFTDQLSVNVWIGFPFTDVSPDQQSYQIGAAMVYQIAF
jgi:hemolysin activation/secretion protein